MPLLYKALISLLGLGYSPILPGTIGSIVAVLISYYFVAPLPLTWRIFIFVLALALFYWLTDSYARRIQERDPRHIVIDEALGVLLMAVFLPPTPPAYVTGFLLFRFFDITKILGSKDIERRLPKTVAIIGDDLLAAIYSVAIVLAVTYLRIL